MGTDNVYYFFLIGRKGEKEKHASRHSHHWLRHSTKHPKGFCIHNAIVPNLFSRAYRRRFESDPDELKFSSWHTHGMNLDFTTLGRVGLVVPLKQPMYAGNGEEGVTNKSTSMTFLYLKAIYSLIVKWKVPIYFYFSFETFHCFILLVIITKIIL